jgi:cytochrome P450
VTKNLPPGPRRIFARRYALRGLHDRPLDFITEIAQRFGDLVYFRARRAPIFFVNHPDLIREVLVTRAEDYVRADAVRNVLRLFDGDSILVSEGDQWRQQRRLLQQGFRSERLRGYARHAEQFTEEMVRHWAVHGPVDMSDEVSRLCMKILSQVLFGTQPPPDLGCSIRAMLDARAAETGRAVSAGHRRPAGFLAKKDKALQEVHAFLEGLIETRRKDSEDCGDLLGVLVRAEPGTNCDREELQRLNRQIRDETVSMINASLDPTEAALTWTLYLVAKHPDVQDRLVAEIHDQLNGKPDSTAEQVEFPFAERVVHESLRLYPPNWALIMRRSLREATLSGFRIPQGSWLYIFPYVVHRDARFFAMPETFDPDRFTPDRFGSLQKASYIPLGLGPHVCIGKALSTIILTSILARILREFRLALPPDQSAVEPEVGIVIRPKNGLRLFATRHKIR